MNGGRNFKKNVNMKTIKYDDRVETLNNKKELHSFNDKPAVVFNDGTKCWYKKGRFHRIFGPAIEYKNGNKKWYKKGEFHRIAGPAIECSDGYKEWYKNGKHHRLDGPAIECIDGSKFWYYEGYNVNFDLLVEFQKNTKKFKTMVIASYDY